MGTEAGRTKVAVVGGGVGGLVTAFWLTSTPELRQQYEVTVHQMGWRLGGKGASGRNAALGQRIEEHGLHIWFGFYDNAFYTMRTCFEELEELAPRPPGCPIRTIVEAFTPNPSIGLYELYDGKWVAHGFSPPARHPVVPRELGTMGPLPSLWHIAANVLAWTVDTWTGLHDELGLTDHHLPHQPVHRFLGLADHFHVDLDEFDIGVRSHLDGWIQDVAGAVGGYAVEHPAAGAFADLLKQLVIDPLVAFKRELWEHVVQSRCGDPRLRMFFTTFDTMCSVLVGVLDEGVLTQGFLSVDDQELTAFLAKHGATPFTLDLAHSPFLRGWYDAAFAYDCSVDPPKPNLAAGTGTHGILRLIGSYRQHIAYKMEAGMGDTIFAPLYELLSARGVHFAFFHQVTGLDLADPSGDGGVAAVRVIRQAEVRGGGEYRPLVDVADLPCWPSEPLWAQLVNGGQLARDGVAFEHGGSAGSPPELVLRRGDDFDLVVLAVPPDAQEELARPLRDRSPAYAGMAGHARSAMTQAGQVWTTTPLDRLGARCGGPAIATGFVEPMDTYCDMSHLLRREVWGQDPPLGVAYFCGVLPDQPDQASADRAVADSMLALLRNYGTVLWPGAADPAKAFDWSHLHAPATATTPEARLGAQYLRANFVPTERYVLSPAGSTVHRLAPGALAGAAPGPDRVPNLYLAGDWTLNGINGGCVEAATMSGMLASRAICSEPREVAGENAEWLSRIEQ